MMNKFLMSLGLVSVLTAFSAVALTLDEARHQGLVGETLSGYLAPRAQDADTLALVSRINAAREDNYRKLAQSNNVAPDDVARLAGQKLVQRVRGGEYVRGINGQWMKK